MNVMSFNHINIILLETIHNLGKILVNSFKDSHTNRIVTCPEKSVLTILAQSLNISLMVFHPTSRTTNHLHVVFECLQIIIISSHRISKLNGYICTLKLWCIEIVRIIDINFTHNLMTTLKGNLLYHMPHLSVAYQCYSHKSCFN